MIPKELLTDYKELYELAMKYVLEESKTDPPTEPFQSHYTARDLLLKMKNDLQNEVTSILAEERDESEDHITYTAILAFVCRDLGRIYIYTEETTTGEEYLNECLKLLSKHIINPAMITTYISAINELGILHSNRLNYQMGLDTLSNAESAYKKFKKSGQQALAISDIFGPSDEIEREKGSCELEGAYTLTTYYLAQVLGHLGKLDKSAKYCHLTLRRQLESRNYDAIDFSLNAATLSQYFIGQNMFKEARHHLAAAMHIILMHKSEISMLEMTAEERAAATETFEHRYADIARCYAKYGLALLLASKERLLNDEVNLITDTNRLSLEPDAYNFSNEDFTAYEKRITANFCLTFEDAKTVFHFVSGWLEEAKSYYKLETEASEYAKIIKDYAELYAHIAFFEDNPENQAKMHKRRAKYYEDLLDSLNQQHYLTFCREAWFGAAFANSAVMDIKLDAIKFSKNATPQEIMKSNQYCQKAIKHFLSFIDSYMKIGTSTLRDDIDVDEQRSILVAYFNVGRLYYKLVNPDLASQLKNITSSLKYYELFIRECAAREEAAQTLKDEIGVCNEMVGLLPLKIDHLKKRMQSS